MRAVHIADIHIHNLQRHSQYKKAFSILYARLAEIKPDVVVITGDIAHSKTEISPEFVSLCSEFLIGVSKLTKRLDIIVGNHDCNVKNRDRKDAISPIVKLINELDVSNIKIFDKSGVFDIDEKFRYAVYSVLDEQEFAIDKSNKVTIGLFHGIIDSAVAENDFSLSSNIKLDYFKGCDYGLFGDIHKRQQLDKEGRFRYPGSFIQQNIKESLDKGFLLWDIKDKKNFSVKEENIYVDSLMCYVKLNESCEIIESSKLLKNSIIRVYYEKGIRKDSLKKFIDELYEKYDAANVIPIKENKKDASETSKAKSISDFSIEKYIVSKKYDDELAQKIIEIDREIESKIDSSLFVNNGLVWGIKKLEWDNLFAYGEGNRIEFSNYEGIVGILGKNRLGKSSIIDIFLWVVFNEVSKKGKKIGWIIHDGAKDAFARIVIESNIGDEYEITRSISRSKKKEKESSSTSVDFNRISNGNKISLNAVDRVNTDKNIRNIFGTFDNFVTTSLAATGLMNNFIKNIDSERFAVLSSFLGLDIFKIKNKLAKEQSDELKISIKSFSNRDFDKELHEARSSIAIAETFCETAARQLKSIDNEKNRLVSKISDLKSKRVDNVDLVETDVIKSELELIEKKISNNNSQLDKLFVDVGSIQGQIFSIKEKSSLAAINKVIEEKYELVSRTLEKAESSLNELSRQERILESSVSILKKIDCENKDCVFISDAFKKKDELLELQNKKKNLSELITKYKHENDNRRAEYDVSKKNGELKDSYEAHHKRLESENNKIQSEINKTEKSRIIDETKMNDLIEKIKQAEKNKEAIENNKKISQEVKIIENEKKLIEDKLDELKSEYDSKVEKLGAAKSFLVEAEKSKDEFFTRKREYEYYEKYLDLTSRTGISFEIMVNNLSLINEELHSILSENDFDFDIIFEENEDHTGIELFMKNKDQKYHLELGSGSESAVSSLAIRLALINVTSLPRLNALILDETFGSLDSDMFIQFQKMFDSIRKMFKQTVIITHINDIKELCDKTIEIARDDSTRESKVCA